MNSELLNSHHHLIHPLHDNSYRLVIDFRALNSISEKDAEPMPILEENLYKFSNVQYFTEIDITKAYHQVPLEENSRRCIFYWTRSGSFPVL